MERIRDDMRSMASWPLAAWRVERDPTPIARCVQPRVKITAAPGRAQRVDVDGLFKCWIAVEERCDGALTGERREFASFIQEHGDAAFNSLVRTALPSRVRWAEFAFLARIPHTTPVRPPRTTTPSTGPARAGR
mgnify:CR=1 FL=1